MLRGRKPRPIMDRFMEKVEIVTESGCWIWLGSINKAGYGRFKMGRAIYGTRHTAKAHHVSYEIFNGERGDLFVCHACDVPSCVNPSHLFLGTNKENVFDMINKGRGYVGLGEDNKNAKLKEKDVIEILASDKSARYLAKAYGVSKSLIGQIKRREIWKHIKL